MIWLHGEDPDFGLASPGSVGAATSGVAVMVDDVDAHCERTRAAGAMIVQEPVDQPYGYRIYSARDNEGGLWSFMRPLDRVAGARPQRDRPEFRCRAVRGR